MSDTFSLFEDIVNRRRSLRAFLPQPIIDAVASLSFWTHFGSISKGVIDIRDLVYFGLVIGAWLAANALVLDAKKAD